MSLEERVASEVRRRGIKITAMAKATGIPYSVLQPSLKSRRPLRADEFFAICDFLETDPKEFTPGQGEKTAGTGETPQSGGAGQLPS